ncbi:hypothetical protein MKX01_035523 [Papaver californicum]|nr:hypothetical protein MKX01_035523 [Papaver californicum]
MEGSGKSFMKVISIVLLIVGMFLGQISAYRESDFEACFETCYNECVKPNPGDLNFRKTCIDKCNASCNSQLPLDSNRKTLVMDVNNCINLLRLESFCILPTHC